MKLKTGLIVAGAALLTLTGAVLSQTITAPLVSTLGQTDIIQIIPRGQPKARSQYAPVPLVTNVYGYYKSAPPTGFVYTFGANVTYANFAPSGTIAVGYVGLPTNPSDGARVCAFSQAQITAFYVCASTTGVGNCSTTNVNGALAGQLSANTGVCYLYSSGNTTWDRN